MIHIIREKFVKDTIKHINNMEATKMVRLTQRTYEKLNIYKQFNKSVRIRLQC